MEEVEKQEIDPTVVPHSEKKPTIPTVAERDVILARFEEEFQDGEDVEGDEMDLYLPR